MQIHAVGCVVAEAQTCINIFSNYFNNTFLQEKKCLFVYLVLNKIEKKLTGIREGGDSDKQRVCVCVLQKEVSCLLHAEHLHKAQTHQHTQHCYQFSVIFASLVTNFNFLVHLFCCQTFHSLLLSSQHFLNLCSALLFSVLLVYVWALSSC